MAIKRPDIYEHNNADYAIADSNFVRGGLRTPVANLTALYALSSKIDQLKEYSTIVYVISESKYYELIDIDNIGNSGGWGIFSSEGSGGGITGATNGLSLVSGGTAVSLGGSLTGDTEIDLNSKNLKILDEVLGFDSGSGFNGYVRSIIIQSDGKILVGGQFTSYSGVTSNRIIRLNSNGSIDTSFVIGTGFNSYVYSIAIQSDGKILVGGGFTSYSGVTSNRIIRLNSNGSIDTSFVIGTGFDNNVKSLTIQSDGKVMVGGSFNTYNGTTPINIVRLNGDGSVDTSFVTGSGFNGEVYVITVQSDGKILCGGGFTTYSGTSGNYTIRLNSDGSIDTSFVIGTGFDSSVRSIIIQSDGKILVGGGFTSYSGNTANKIIRLNSNGSIDTSFVSGSGFDNGNVLSIGVQSNGKILVGGNFETYSGTTANCIIKLNSNGNIETSFVYGTGFNFDVFSIAIQSNGKVLVGGSFNTYNGTTANCVMRLNPDGSVLDKIGIVFSDTSIDVSNVLNVYNAANFSDSTRIYNNLTIQSGATFLVLSNAGAGKVLTSDASGNMTLQLPSGGTGGDENNVYSYSAITSSTVLTTGSSFVILANPSTGLTITLPSAPINGQVVRIKDISGSASTNIIAINGNGKNIDGSSTGYVNTDYGGIEIMYNGTAWYVLSFVN